MKLQGKVLDGPQERVVVFPRQNGDKLVFKFKAVLNSDEFDKICPVPEPPEMILPGGGKKLALDDKTYLKKLEEWSQNKTHYMFLESISATDDLEWETVDLGNPETWKNYQKELEDAGFTESERLVMLRAYSEVQGLDQSKIDEATRSFLADLQEAIDE